MIELLDWVSADENFLWIAMAGMAVFFGMQSLIDQIFYRYAEYKKLMQRSKK